MALRSLSWIGRPAPADRTASSDRLTYTELKAVLNGQHIVGCQRVVRKVPVPDHVLDFVLDIVRKSRPHEPDALPLVQDLVEWGPGPRAAQCLIMGAKVRALLRGRYHVTDDDVEALAKPVLRHRLVPTFNAEAQGIKVDDIIDQIVAAVPRGTEVQLL